MPGQPEISPLRAEHARAVGDVLAASHADYPAFVHVFPDPVQRSRALRAFFASVGRDAAPFQSSTVAVADDRLLGVAVWLPPGAFPWTAGRKLRSMPALLAVLRAAPRRFRTFAALGANAERLHPTDRHWYLEVLGVRPEAQGLGLGTRLTKAGLARADSDALPCYLETSRRENVAFYERLGFQVENDALPLVPGGPTHWAMRRPARPRGACPDSGSSA